MSKPWEKNLNDLHSSSSISSTPSPLNYLQPPLTQAPRLPTTSPYSTNGTNYLDDRYGNPPLYYNTTPSYNNSYNSYSSPYNNRFNSSSLPTTFNPATFATIENIVHAFTSFSNMLQSTLGALYSSIRAIYDVIEHFSHLSLTLHSLSFVRFLKFLWRRIFKRNQLDDAWPENSVTNSATQWPLFIFLIIAVGGPILLRSMMTPDSFGPFLLVAVHSHKSTDPKQLSFKTGDVFENLSDTQHANSGWIRVKKMKNGKIGYVPASYLKKK